MPISAPPLRDAAIRIAGDQIISVGPWRSLPRRFQNDAIDLGDALLMPGLVNAHCHLDYTDMAGQLPPQKHFTDWVKLIVSIKAGWNLADYAASWKKGADMLLRNGTTTVADIEAVPQLLPRMLRYTPLRVFSFLEMINISKQRKATEVLGKALRKISRLRPAAFGLGLSPHAAYTASAELLRLSAKAARSRGLLLSTHLAESATETQMFRDASGDMFDWLARSGRDMSDCGQGSPVQHVFRCGLLGSRFLAAHVNHLLPGDAALIANSGSSIVHCPRSHFYFRHSPFPLRKLLRAGVNVCLGSDSLASVYKGKTEAVELDMFAEMREFSDTHPYVSARSILRMATENGARALGLGNRIGVLKKGALADLIVLPLPSKSLDLYAIGLGHSGPVLGVMINGKWSISPATR